MDLLKKVLRDPSTCEMGAGEIVVDGRMVPRTQTVKFRNTETKEYTFEQVVFYLVNRDKKYTTYMSLCRDAGISKIYYTDQKIIIEEIESAQSVPVAVRADGVDFRYMGSRDYSYLGDVCRGETRPATKYIIVPQSLSSPVNLNSVKEFFSSGRCEGGVNVGEEEEVSMRMDGVDFVVKDNVGSFTSEDWKKIVAVFLDGTRWQTDEWNVPDVAEILNSVPTFYVARAGARKGPHLRNYNVTEVPVRNGVVGVPVVKAVKEKIMAHVQSR